MSHCEMLTWPGKSAARRVRERTQHLRSRTDRGRFLHFRSLLETQHQRVRKGPGLTAEVTQVLDVYPHLLVLLAKQRHELGAFGRRSCGSELRGKAGILTQGPEILHAHGLQA